MERDFESTRLILSTYDPTRVIPSDDQAMVYLQPIYLRLFDTYGQEAVLALGDVSADGIDRAEVCAITMDLYQEVLALDEAGAVTALRWMFGQ